MRYLDNTAIRQKASQVLTDPDFQRYHPQEKWFDFWKWLRQFLNFKLPFEVSGGNPPIWQWVGLMMKTILLIGALTVVGFSLYWLFQRLCPKAGTVETFRVSAERRLEAQEMYLKQAAEALKNQDYRLAIHFLFLAAVSQVIKDAQFNSAEFMTNREMASASDFSRFRQSASLSAMFQEMVYFDEPRWFGREQVPEKDYEAFKSLYHQFSLNLKTTAGRRQSA